MVCQVHWETKQRIVNQTLQTFICTKVEEIPVFAYGKVHFTHLIWGERCVIYNYHIQYTLMLFIGAHFILFSFITTASGFYPFCAFAFT